VEDLEDLEDKFTRQEYYNGDGFHPESDQVLKVFDEQNFVRMLSNEVGQRDVVI
jgi:hypothetical protein